MEDAAHPIIVIITIIVVVTIIIMNTSTPSNLACPFDTLSLPDQVLRFTDWMSTNSADNTGKWADRTKPEQDTQAHASGGAYQNPWS